MVDSRTCDCRNITGAEIETIVDRLERINPAVLEDCLLPDDDHGFSLGSDIRPPGVGSDNSPGVTDPSALATNATMGERQV